MKVELMIYVYIAICVSMIAYNLVYIFILNHRAKALVSDSKKLEKSILEEIDNLKYDKPVSDKHIDHLYKTLNRSAGITAFDKAFEGIFEKDPEMAQEYILETFFVFEDLTHRYIKKDSLKIAYFPYILHKYEILKFDRNERVLEVLFDLLRSVNVYCRENTLKALYSIQDPDIVVSSLRIIDKNLTFHHPKLICDGLLVFKGDKNELKDKLFEVFDELSVQMKVNILNYFRFGNVSCDQEMLSVLKDEKEDQEMRFSAIRYFEKFPSEKAKPIILELAENEKALPWEYQAIATSALKSYPGDKTFGILVKNLSNSNWHVRQNSAISCEKLGYTYLDLINVFDGNDRYAREIMRYWLDRRKAEEEVLKT